MCKYRCKCENFVAAQNFHKPQIVPSRLRTCRHVNTVKCVSITISHYDGADAFVACYVYVCARMYVCKYFMKICFFGLAATCLLFYNARAYTYICISAHN